MQLLRAGEVHQALQQFDVVLKSNPHSAYALIGRGVCENQLQQYAAAALDFKAALHLDPASVSAHYNYALTLIRLHQEDAAIAQLRMVLNAQPEALQPLYNLAVLLEAKGAYAEAAERLRVAHRVAPEDPGIAVHFLADLLHLDTHAEVASLIAELSAESTPSALQRDAGAALLGAGRAAEANPLLMAAYNREPNFETALLLARSLLAADQAQAALTLLSNSTPAGAGNEEVAQFHTLIGIAMAATHDPRGATAQLQTALSLDPRLAIAQNVLGFCQTQQGQYVQAAEAYQEASELEPRRAVYARDAALASSRASDTAQAIRFAQRVTTLTPEDAAAHALLGKLYASANQPRQALPELQRAVAIDPDLDAAVYQLARVYQATGDHAQAVAWSEKLAALKQKHAAEFAQQKKNSADPVHAAALLGGGALPADDAGGP
ncbi:tetratricopeptide repeat protein [Acidipila sp. EB88]|uniref:tetratricopeptide repeat protein n=1 Tax=Acidipila sp. EB88 TaxID=2305226 RepID=UPI001315204B|nr:tetratricopeptide repeat protein [Acidipila sp. EB88]